MFFLEKCRLKAVYRRTKIVSGDEIEAGTTERIFI